MRGIAIVITFVLVTASVAADAPIELPEVNVSSTRPGRFSTRGIAGTDGVNRVFVVPARSRSPDGTYLYGDFRVGDEIVQADGVNAASLAKGELSGRLRAGAKVIVRRRVALQTYDLIEVECRRAEPAKTPPQAPTRKAVPQ